MVRRRPGVLLSYNTPMSEWNQKNQRLITQENAWRRFLKEGASLAEPAREEVPKVRFADEGVLRAYPLGSGAPERRFLITRSPQSWFLGIRSPQSRFFKIRTQEPPE